MKVGRNIVVKGAPRLGATRRHPSAPRLKAGNAPSGRRRLGAQGARLRQGARRSPESPPTVRPAPFSGLSQPETTPNRALASAVLENSEIRDAFLTNVCILYNLKQVAEKLMTMHEECLEGNYQSIEKLREASSRPAVHHIRQVILVIIRLGVPLLPSPFPPSAMQPMTSCSQQNHAGQENSFLLHPHLNTLQPRKLELFNKALEMEICQRERKLVKENGRENVARRWQQVTKQSWTALPGKESPKVRG
ncbi:hypothetical protein CK203_056194 [Vitis vinifera]|uniref:Uncharacterized protein n=1 Tax=Vitis vinifera TaxID=29760 RepID=A0A438GDG9_VITVI|nr:hypothetical protein CK203_056194 [Vitis vinifera]